MEDEQQVLEAWLARREAETVEQPQAERFRETSGSGETPQAGSTIASLILRRVK